jgi:hypothetical protein
LWRDWLIELRYPSVTYLRTLLSYGYESFRVGGAVRRADGIFACAHDVGTKVRGAFALESNPGFLPSPIAVPQFSGTSLTDLLSESWILVNTAEREGLPTSFLEAFAHGCAILSRVNPDNLVERFGEVVPDDAFAEGLERLLAGDAWKAKGEGGRRYVHEYYELGNVVDRHLEIYHETLRG